MTDDLAWETLDAAISYTCEGFDVRTDKVRFPDGSEGEFDYLVEPESVVVLPFTAAGVDAGGSDDAKVDDAEVVVIEEWRQAVGRVNRGLPAGSIEPDDDAPADAVARELEEETGYVPGDVAHLTTVEPANGFANSVFQYFVARDCEPNGEQNLDSNEDIRVDTTTFGELVDAARDGELRDGRSMQGILYYALFERGV